MRPLPGFVYADWARFGVGSSVEFLDDQGNELNFKLLERDGRRAILDVSRDRAGMTRELGEPSVLAVWVQPPEPLPRPGSARAAALLLEPEAMESLKGWIEEVSTPSAQRGPVLAEGKEVLLVDGEDQVCAWVETAEEKIWLLDEVPGGIVQWETHSPASRFRLRSFEAISGPSDDPGRPAPGA